MQIDDLIISFLLSFTELNYQVPGIIHLHPEIFQTAVAYYQDIPLQMDFEIKKTGLTLKRNPCLYLSILHFQAFKFLKERFAKNEFKFMNTLFQPFEMNNILILNFQISRIKKSGAKVGIYLTITKKS
jgi:hypothetical protein